MSHYASNNLYFQNTCNIKTHFLGSTGGLKIEGLLHTHTHKTFEAVCYRHLIIILIEYTRLVFSKILKSKF